MERKMDDDLDQDAIRDAVFGYLQHHTYNDFENVTNKTVRKHVETELQLPDDSLKSSIGRSLLVLATTQYKRMIQEQQEFINSGGIPSSGSTEELLRLKGCGTIKSITTTIKSSSSSSSSSNVVPTNDYERDSGHDDSNNEQEDDDDEEEETAIKWKRGKYSRAECTVIRMELQKFAAENNIDLEQLAPYFRDDTNAVAGKRGRQRGEKRQHIWRRIQEKMPNRSRMSIYDWSMRWLMRDIKEYNFSEAELVSLQSLIDLHGRNSWKKIAQALGKTPDACRQAELRCLKNRKKTGRIKLDECVRIVLAARKILKLEAGQELPQRDVSWVVLAAELKQERHALDYNRAWSSILKRVKNAGGIDAFLNTSRVVATTTANVATTAAASNATAASERSTTPAPVVPGGGSSREEVGTAVRINRTLKRTKLELCQQEVELLELLQESTYCEERDVNWYEMDRQLAVSAGFSACRWRLLRKSCPTNNPSVYTFEEKVEYLLELKTYQLQNMQRFEANRTNGSVVALTATTTTANAAAATPTMATVVIGKSPKPSNTKQAAFAAAAREESNIIEEDDYSEVDYDRMMDDQLLLNTHLNSAAKKSTTVAVVVSDIESAAIAASKQQRRVSFGADAVVTVASLEEIKEGERKKRRKMKKMKRIEQKEAELAAGIAVSTATVATESGKDESIEKHKKRKRRESKLIDDADAVPMILASQTNESALTGILSSNSNSSSSGSSCRVDSESEEQLIERKKKKKKAKKIKSDEEIDESATIKTEYIPEESTSADTCSADADDDHIQKKKRKKKKHEEIEETNSWYATWKL